MKKVLLLIFSISVIFASNFPTGTCSQVINKKVISICYDYHVRGAKYVKYTIYSSTVNKLNIKKRPRFYTQKTIPSKYRTTYSDYTDSIGSDDCGGGFNIYSHINPTKCRITYDRGHLAPDADFDYNKKILKQVYTMANIIPQVSVVNRKTWSKVEAYERRMASKLGRLNVVIGIEYNNPTNFLSKKPLSLIKNSNKWSRYRIYRYQREARTLRKKKILIPTAFWKHFTGPNGFNKCFYYKNKEVNYKLDKLKNHEINCNKIKDLL